MAESIPYIFQCINNATTKEQKKNILSQYGNNQIKQILYYAFHPDVKFVLPKGMPPYNYMGGSSGYPKTLYPKVRELKIFVEGEYKNLPKIKKEILFIKILEEIHPDEAKIVCAMKDKILNTLYNGLTYDLVKEVYPDLLPNISPVKEEKNEDKKSGTKNSRTTNTKRKPVNKKTSRVKTA